MTDDRLIRLIAARERGALSPAEENELLTALAENPDVAASAGWDHAIDRLIRYSLTTELGEQEFTRGVAARIVAEKRGEEFVRRVARQVRVRRALPRSTPNRRIPLWISAAACAVILLAVAAVDRGRKEVERPAARNMPVPGRIVVADRATPAVEIQTPRIDRFETLQDLSKPKNEGREQDSLVIEEPVKASMPAPSVAPAVSGPSTTRTTLVTIGTLERFEGAVWIEKTAAREGQVLRAGQTLETGSSKGKAVLRLGDGTRLDLAENTVLSGPAAHDRILLSRGTLLADVAKRQMGDPLIFETPSGTATVLGTTLRLTVITGEKGSTRLEVTEGKVRLTRTTDGKSIEVSAGSFAVAAPGIEFKSKPLPDPRVAEGLRALYLFDEGKGRVIRDVSGVGAPLHLVAREEGALQWIPGGGVSLREPALVASSGPATKIVSACRSSRGISVEAWIRPTQAIPGTLRYVVALGGTKREAVAFGLGLNVDTGNGPATYRVSLVTPKTLPASEYVPEIATSPIVPGLSHVVFTRAASGMASVFVDGKECASGIIEGDFSNWNDSLRLLLGDFSFEGTRPWVGEFHLLALYSRALQPEEILQNYAVGKRKLPAFRK